MNQKPTLSVVIPCFNEKDNILELVHRVLAAPVENKEIIIVDDCSTDGTKYILETAIEPLVDKIIYSTVNQGKGASLRTGFEAATGIFVIVQDADQEYDPNEYARVIQPLLDGSADVVYGSRFLETSTFAGYFQNIIANRVLTHLSNLFTGFRLTDMETCYKAFRSDILRSIIIQENRFGFEPEITAKIARLKCRVTEVPISYSPRTKQQGKKIGFKDGLRALFCIVKYGGR